jgi:Flp pilus assembly protein TadD
MARDDCRKAQELSLRSPVQQAALGNSLVKYGDYAAAVEPFRAALQLDPGMGEVRLRLIDALLESQQRDAARQEADECRRRNVTVPAGRLDKLDPHEGKPPAGP